jgi:hypothetical protein
MFGGRRFTVWGIALIALAASGCAISEGPGLVLTQEKIEAGTVLRRTTLDAATAQRLLVLDAENISRREVDEVLARAPAPRIILLHGSVPFITMQPFAEFLIAMGYPEAALRNPRDGAYTYSSYADSRRLAGELAWYYEHEGMMPLLIGHSQGGMLVIKVLHELAGAFTDRVPVWNPLTDAAEGRDTIIDPISGKERPVIGLQVSYAAALATGKLMRVVLGQWDMLSKLRAIPDTVAEFIGFTIEGDPFTFSGERDDAYQAIGTATVRNVRLPSSYGHITLPLTSHLASQPSTRAWLDDYRPGHASSPVPGNGADTSNLLHAAELWYGVKKAWCLEAQRLIRAQRASAIRQGAA